VAEGFLRWSLPAPDHLFEALMASACFEELGKGRRGTVLVRPGPQGAVPLVRTTTSYRRPAQPFLDLHDRLAEEIQRTGSLPLRFNNALIEHYTNAYASMKHHSDQALDLAPDSWIALFSCYQNPARPSRRLLIKPKHPGGPTSEILLAHASVVAFSLDTNRRFTHSIALAAGAPSSDWLGLTFRTSSTFVQFVNGHPRLPDGAPLILADDEQRRAFFLLRRQENSETDFSYPPLSFTLSASDLLPTELQLSASREAGRQLR
jgi:hypothetical protein